MPDLLEGNGNIVASVIGGLLATLIVVVVSFLVKNWKFTVFLIIVALVAYYFLLSEDYYIF